MRAVSVEFPIPRWLRARELDGANRRSFRESPVCISPHAYPIGALGNLAVLTATQSAQAQGCVRLCEHVFVTSQGSPATRFKRAIERRSLINAELAAREMDQVSLEDALALVILYAQQAEVRDSSGRRSGGSVGCSLEKLAAALLGSPDASSSSPNCEARRRSLRRRRSPRSSETELALPPHDGDHEARNECEHGGADAYADSQPDSPAPRIGGYTRKDADECDAAEDRAGLEEVGCGRVPPQSETERREG